jgi:hypothetical protein
MVHTLVKLVVSEMDLREFLRDVIEDIMLLKDGLVTLLVVLPADIVLALELVVESP